MKKLSSSTSNSYEHTCNLKTLKSHEWVKLRRLRVYLGATNLNFLSIKVLLGKLKAMLPQRGKGFGPKMYDFSLLNQYKQLSTH